LHSGGSRVAASTTSRGEALRGPARTLTTTGVDMHSGDAVHSPAPRGSMSVSEIITDPFYSSLSLSRPDIMIAVLPSSLSPFLRLYLSLTFCSAILVDVRVVSETSRLDQLVYYVVLLCGPPYGSLLQNVAVRPSVSLSVSFRPKSPEQNGSSR